METVDSNDALANPSVGRDTMGDVVQVDERIIASILGPRVDSAEEVGEARDEACDTYRQCRWERREGAAGEDDERFMRLALRLAERAHDEGEVPIGAVLTETVARDGGSGGRKRVLATGRNVVERTNDASAHAEMVCMQAGAKARGNWRLSGSTLYVTVEPCVMCLSAAQLFRVDRVVFGAPNPNLGACGGWVDLPAQKHAFHDLEVHGGVLANKCARLLRGFFRSRRLEGEDTETTTGKNDSDNFLFETGGNGSSVARPEARTREEGAVQAESPGCLGVV